VIQCPRPRSIRPVCGLNWFSWIFDASAENRKTVVEVIRKAASGDLHADYRWRGVKSVEDFRELLSNGADKVSVNTACARTGADQQSLGGFRRAVRGIEH